MTFDVSGDRVSGGHLTGRGDPRGDYSFANLLKSIGGEIPGPGGAPMGDALIIHEPGTFIPAANKAAAALGSKKPNDSPASGTKPTQVKGLGGLAGLRK